MEKGMRQLGELGRFPSVPVMSQLDLCFEGTWCSWLSRSLSIFVGDLREGSGSIPDVSIFLKPFYYRV
jgi:hypothetical protein